MIYILRHFSFLLYLDDQESKSGKKVKMNHKPRLFLLSQNALDHDLCQSPSKMTEAELQTELFRRGMKPTGDKESMIRQLTTPGARKCFLRGLVYAKIAKICWV